MNESSAKRELRCGSRLCFVLGTALGGVFGYFYGHRSSVSAANPPLSEAVKRAQRVEELTQELGLTDDQRQQLDKAAFPVPWRVQIRSTTSPKRRWIRHGRRGRDQIRVDPDSGTEAEVRGVPKAHGRRKKAESAAASTALVLHTLNLGIL